MHIILCENTSTVLQSFHSSKFPKCKKAEIEEAFDSMIQNVVQKTAPYSAIYPFHSHAYELLLLTQSANWSEPPLRRTQWPPTPTLPTVADCQVGKSACARVWSSSRGQRQENTELGNSYNAFHNLQTLRYFTQDIHYIQYFTLQMTFNLLCYRWAGWQGTLWHAAKQNTALPCLAFPWNCTTYGRPQIPLPKMWAPCHSACY